MILGHLIIGILIGVISAAVSLFLGSSIVWALFIYVAAGCLGLLLSAFIAFVRSVLSESDTVNTRLPSISSHFWFLNF